MADKPIIFSAPMVRALLEGRKTQTRRVLKQARVFATPESRAFTIRGDNLARALQGADRFRHLGGQGWFWEADAFDYQAPATRTGWMADIGFAPGDRLWVRERFFGGHPGCANVCYYADQIHPMLAVPWKPSIHIPRRLSRISLTVTDVRVERLQDISEADAIAEGVVVGAPLTEVPDSLGDIYHDGVTDPIDGWTRDPFEAFARLWNSAYGPNSWSDNPWVVAVTFDVRKGNIDAE